MTEFIFANDSWGVKNTSTGTWPFGVVSLVIKITNATVSEITFYCFKVGFGHADLGTGFISYSSERYILGYSYLTVCLN